MNRTIALGAVLLLSLAALGQSETRRPQYEQAFRSGGSLKLELSAGDYTVRASRDTTIRVFVDAKDPNKLKDVKFSTATAGGNGKLKITGPHNNIMYTVEVPARLDLVIRLSAGDLKVSGIEGSKDIELHAGDLNLHVGDPAAYWDVDLSVRIGDLNAGPWSVSKGGIARSFHQARAGKYKLHAHVGAGDLNVLEDE